MILSVAHRPSPLVGRDVELSRFGDVIGTVASGRPQVVIISGPAGIGKSRFVAEVRRRHEDCARFFIGPAISVGGDDLPLAPLMSALRRSGADWPPPVETTDPSGRLVVLESLLDTLGRLSASLPVVLGLEDVHWADPSTRSALDFLARNLSDERIAVLVTVRDELASEHPWRSTESELLRLDLVQRWQLAPLDRRQTAELVAAHLDDEPSPSLLEEVWRRGSGNPFYTEELVESRRRGEVGLPPTLAQILERQVDELPVDLRRFLRVASVIGREWSVDEVADIASVAGIDPSLAVDAVRAALDSGFVVRTGERLTFRHPLQREAAAASLLASERRALHTAIADRLETSGADGAGIAARLARHRHLAGDRERAHGAALRAARLSRQAHDHLGALGLLEIAIETVDPGSDSGVLVDLVVEASDTARDAGLTDRAVELAQRAFGLCPPGSDPAARLRVAAALAIASRDALDYRGGLELVGGVLDEMEGNETEVDPAARCAAFAAAASLASTARKWESAVRFARTGRALAAELGATFETARCEAVLAATEVLAGRIEDGLERMARAERTAFDGGHRQLGFTIRTNRCQTLLHLGRFTDCAELGEDGMDDSRAAGLGRTMGAFLAGSVALAALHRGEIDRAARAVRHAADDAVGLAGLMTTLAEARLALVGVDPTEPDPDPALMLLRRAEERAGGGLGLVAASWAAIRLEAAILEDDPVIGVAEARAVLEQAEPAILLTTCGWLLSRASFLRAGRPSVDPALAASIGALELWIRERVDPAVGVIALMAETEPWRRLADAAAGSPPPGGWAQLATDLAAAGLGGEICWAHQAEAVVAVESGDRAAAAVAVASVLDDPAAHPAAVWLAADLARRGRLSRPTSDQEPDESVRLGLTARELEVLRLVAAGLTNRELAEQLYISPKTASVHVSNLMRKLGVSDRRAAAAVARRLGLIDAAV